MYQNIITKTLYFYLSCLLVVPVHGQQKEIEQVQFVAISKITGADSLGLRTGDDEWMPVQIPVASLSRSYKIAHPKNWIIGRKVSDKQGSEEFVPAGQASALKSNRQVVIVAPQKNTNPEELLLTPYSIDKSEFPGGGYLLINMSSSAASGNLGESRFELAAGSSVLLLPKASEEKNGFKYLYAVINRGLADDAKPLHRSTWRLNDQAQTIILIHDDETGQQLLVRTLRSFPE